MVFIILIKKKKPINSENSHQVSGHISFILFIIKKQNHHIEKKTQKKITTRTSK